MIALVLGSICTDRMRSIDLEISQENEKTLPVVFFFSIKPPKKRKQLYVCNYASIDSSKPEDLSCSLTPPDRCSVPCPLAR